MSFIARLEITTSTVTDLHKSLHLVRDHENEIRDVVLAATPDVTECEMRRISAQNSFRITMKSQDNWDDSRELIAKRLEELLDTIEPLDWVVEVGIALRSHELSGPTRTLRFEDGS